MGKEKSISHSGKIVEVTPGKVRVEIVSSSACGSCHAAGLCSMSEAVKKIVEVPAVPGEHYAAGEEVEVMLAPSMGMKAVVLAYVIPLVILLILCVSLSYTKTDELLIGLIGLGGVALYYLVLYLIRDRFAKEYVFYIKKH